jgi:hypothetical protein
MGPCEHGKKPFTSTKDEVILYQVTHCKLLKKWSGPVS